MKGCMKLFQFRLLGQLFVIVPPAICMGDAYSHGNSDSEKCEKTCVLLLPECRFHVRLPLILRRGCRSHRAWLFIFTPFAKIAAGTRNGRSCSSAVVHFSWYATLRFRFLN